MSEARRSLLIVDDLKVNRTLACVLLRGSDWSCDQAESGEEALRALDAKAYDCVLLDIGMPGMTGDDVCRAIRANERLRGLRVVAYTAHTMQEDRERILAAGFDALLIKPVSKSDLSAALEAS